MSKIVAPSCGNQLAVWPLSSGQPSLSNGQDQGTSCSCGGGALYQCVNYVNRYYKNVMGVDTSEWHANAADYYTYASQFGLDAFPNGGTTSPATNDILVFQDGPGQFGHVAIIESVSPTQVTIIEQNWSANGTATVPLQVANGGYNVGQRGNCAIPTNPSCFTPVGWLRLPGNVLPNPVPAITMLSPALLAAGTAPQTLTINGTGFLATSTVTFNGIAHSAVYLSTNQLTISLSSADLATAGSYPVIVTNPSPGGGSSATLTFTVSPTNPIPAITSLSPASLSAGAAPQTLTINGTGFMATSTVTFNGASHLPTYVSATQLTILLTATDLATAGTYLVVVTNPAPGGGSSVEVNFTVSPSNPIPAITSLSPASLVVGATPQALTIDGSGFLTTSTVTFDGISHTATFVSASQLTISLTATDLATAGSYPVVVTNPAPGGGSSAAVSFAVSQPNPIPTITTPLVPAWQTAGSLSQTLKINGTGFLASSTVAFNGINHPVAFISSNQLTISLNSADLAKPGLFSVVVANPAPGGGSSGSADFFVVSGQMTGDWTWMSGGGGYGETGVYGTQGIPSASNMPGATEGAVSWIDGNGNLWLFGGDGLNSADASAELNDIWEFNIANGTWTWVSGSSAQIAGVYGTLGVPASTNMPGARVGAAGWTDSSGNLWMFGGFGEDSMGSPGSLNDLWKLNIASGTWTWMSGSSTLTANSGPPGIYGTKGVPAATNVPGGRNWAVISADNSGNIWLFGGFGYDSTGTILGNLNDLWKFNIASSTWTWISGNNSLGTTTGQPGVYGTQGVPAVTNTPGGREGPANWIDSGGNLWIFGGFGPDSTGASLPLNDLWEFNFTSSMWTWVGGSNIGGQPGIYGSQGIPQSTNLPGARGGAAAWTSANGTIWLFGGEGYASTSQQGYLNDLWQFDPATGTWVWMGGSSTIGTSGYTLGNYGVEGVPASSNVPGSRSTPATWVDKNGNLWLFGGYVCDAVTCTNNDLWQYQP